MRGEPVALDDMSAAPVEIELNGKTYTVSPITIGDVGKMNRWSIQQHLNARMQAMAGLDPDLQQTLATAITAPLTDAQKEEIYDAEGPTVEGIIHTFYLMLKHAHPNLTEEQAAVLASEENMDKINEAIAQLSPPAAKDETGGSKNATETPKTGGSST
jgi:hypothetical protein